MNSRLTSICLIALCITIQFVSATLDEGDLEVSRTIEPRVLSRLESQFLKLFGMERRPEKRKSSIKIPGHLVKLYKAQTGLDLPTSNLNLPGRHTRTANTVRTFYPTTPRLRFDISSIPPKEEVTGAEIRAPFNRTALLGPHANNPRFADGKVRVIINDVVKFNPRTEPIMYPVDSKFVDLKKRSEVFSLTFDVFPAVQRWISSEKANRGLIVQVFDQTGTEEIRWTWDMENRRDAPALFTYSDDGLHKRKTRDAPTLSRHYRAAVEERRNRKKHRNKNRKRNLCAKHKMFVDFTDVGWNDWIVAPPGYHAYHCAGECPFPMAEHLNATNHAVIQALVNSMNPQQVPPPCCVPTKYSSLSLLYTDSSDKTVLKNYNEMIVDSCGCS